VRSAIGRLRVVAATVLVAVVTVAPPTFADARQEASARAALKNAKADFAASNFGLGAARLHKALKACGERKCAPGTRAALLMDLGAMQLKRGVKDEASRAFSDAAALVPAIAPDPVFDSPELRAALATATGTAATSEGVERPTGDIAAPPEVAPAPVDLVQVHAASPGQATRSSAEPRSVRGFKRIWIGASAELEFMTMPSASDVCALDPATGLPANGDNLYCTTQAGSDFPTRSLTLENAGLCTAAQVASGLCTVDLGGRTREALLRGNLRVVGSFDYAVTANLLVGARLGATLFPYPGRAAVNDGRDLGSRIYGEVRGTWVFGANAIGSPGLKPLVFLGGGVASFEGHASSAVAFCPAAQPASAGKPCQVPLDTGTVNVWRTGGPGFATLGLGLRWVATPAIALTVAARVNLTFRQNGWEPTFLPFVPTFGPELAAQYGF
jgi:hypothetical protein